MTIEQTISLSDRMAVRSALTAERHDLEDIRQRLDRAANRLAERMQHVQDALARGYTVNSLGEVQGQGLDVDRLCALYAAKAQSLGTLTRVAALLGVSDEDEAQATPEPQPAPEPAPTCCRCADPFEGDELRVTIPLDEQPDGSYRVGFAHEQCTVAPRHLPVAGPGSCLCGGAHEYHLGPDDNFMRPVVWSESAIDPASRLPALTVLETLGCGHKLELRAAAYVESPVRVCLACSAVAEHPGRCTYAWGYLGGRRSTCSLDEGHVGQHETQDGVRPDA